MAGPCGEWQELHIVSMTLLPHAKTPGPEDNIAAAVVREDGRLRRCRIQAPSAPPYFSTTGLAPPGHARFYRPSPGPRGSFHKVWRKAKFPSARNCSVRCLPAQNDPHLCWSPGPSDAGHGRSRQLTTPFSEMVPRWRRKAAGLWSALFQPAKCLSDAKGRGSFFSRPRPFRWWHSRHKSCSSDLPVSDRRIAAPQEGFPGIVHQMTGAADAGFGRRLVFHVFCLRRRFC